MKDLQKRLREIRRTVAPFNRQQEKAKENPFKVGELVLIFQQPMERDHNLFPKWRRPFPIVKVENPFQVCYDDRGREKIAHARHCKKFKTSTTSGRENYVISSNDVTSSDLWTPQGGRSDDVEEACDLLTSNEGRHIGSTMANIQNQKKMGRNFKHHSLPRRRRKMLLLHIEVCFQGSVLNFKDIPSFATWVESFEGSCKVMGISGVGAQQGHSDPLLSHFVTLELHLQGPLGCWQRQRIGCLHKRCGHHLIVREAVMRNGGKAHEEEEVLRPVVEGFRHVTLSCSDVTLQEAPPTTVTSEAEEHKCDPQAMGE